MPLTLRDGSVTEDVRLDRIVQFDERSRDFPVAAVVPPVVRPRTWSVTAALNQGREGACVGFGIAHELSAVPTVIPGMTYEFAYRLYRKAQFIDPWPGEGYSGTSVLAGTKVAQEMGYFDSYRWCFSVDDIMHAVSSEGPVVVGTVWYEGMYTPRKSGLLKPGEGKIVGGHCYLIRGLTLKRPLPGEGPAKPMFRIRNSWGPSWGVGADAYITVEDYERYLMPESDAVVFVGRKKPL